MLESVYVSNEMVFLGPAVKIVSHLVGAEVRDQYLFPMLKIQAAQLLELLEHDDHIGLGQAF